MLEPAHVKHGMLTRIAGSAALSFAVTAGLFLAAVIFWVFFGFLLPYLWTDASFETRGQFGDMFGAANSLFAGLAAFFSFASTLLLLHGIKKQQEEMEDLRRQHAITKKNVKSQKLIEMANAFYKLDFIKKFDIAKGVLEYSFFRSAACDDEARTKASIKVSLAISDWLRTGNTDIPIKHIYNYMVVCSPGYPVSPSAPPKEFAKFAYVVNWISIYSSIILSERPAISEFDFLRHHWSRIRSMIMPIVEGSLTSNREAKLNFLQDNLLNLDRYYNPFKIESYETSFGSTHR